MNVLRVRNVHRALPLAVEMLRIAGVRRPSRNGDVFQPEAPVTTVYQKPLERVLFWAERDANPFFHFFESLWMLGGKNDVESVARFAKQVREYTDDGSTFHGVYGYRWRVGMPSYGPGVVNDQLIRISSVLRDNPADRRQVLQMWDAASDLGNPSKDVPCNVTATLQVGSDGCLHLVVFNRSNDVVWGCYGANAVQFSTLLEYVAARSNLPVGTYTQVSVNWHGYEKTYLPLLQRFQETANSQVPDQAKSDDITSIIEEESPYETGQVTPYPLISKGTDPIHWDQGLQRLLRANGRCPVTRFDPDPFFYEVAYPILTAHDLYKDSKDYEGALRALENCRASDWRLACSEWITRRWKKAME